MRSKIIRSSTAEKRSQPSGESTTFLLTGKDTDGRVSMFDSRLKKGNGAPWHYHDYDDEIFYVVSGKVEFGVGTETVVADSGDLVLAGPGVHRRFTALEDSHLVVVNAPGGPSERFLRDVMSLDSRITETDRIRFASDYGIHVVTSPTE